MRPDTAVEGSLTQFAVLDALLAGVYESGMPVGEALAAGDFGIGCCERLGGEVVIVDGVAWECPVDGPPTPMTDDEVLPFVEACRLQAATSVPIARMGLSATTHAVEAGLASRNLFHAVRIDGRFDAVRVRATPRQRHPLPPLAEVTEHQQVTELRGVDGTLVGFWAPAIYQGITVAGLHAHFLSADRTAGGHVLDLDVAEGDLRVAAYPRFELRLPTDPLFLATELGHDLDHRIVAIEGGA